MSEKEQPKSIWLDLNWWVGIISFAVVFGLWSWAKAGGHFI